MQTFGTKLLTTLVVILTLVSLGLGVHIFFIKKQMEEQSILITDLNKKLEATTKKLAVSEANLATMTVNFEKAISVNKEINEILTKQNASLKESNQKLIQVEKNLEVAKKEGQKFKERAKLFELTLKNDSKTAEENMQWLRKKVLDIQQFDPVQKLMGKEFSNDDGSGSLYRLAPRPLEKHIQGQS